ncbi:hypothetical protein FKP32DRAFT_1247361 [Trametes sanguinea]|nr:hypothetical protein FKP32DRAFT_1247361 [Trametes sanguinea]
MFAPDMVMDVFVVDDAVVAAWRGLEARRREDACTNIVDAADLLIMTCAVLSSAPLPPPRGCTWLPFSDLSCMYLQSICLAFATCVAHVLGGFPIYLLAILISFRLYEQH